VAHILVIEDEPHIRLILRKVLETNGHTITEADDGLEATDIIRTRFDPFSLIILDIGLPKMDGFEFLYRLRRQQRFYMPVLVITAHPRSCAKAEEYGADGCLTKPFDPGEVVEAATRLIETQTNKTYPFKWKFQQTPRNNE
jgi:DNA-binding response OmpR family regulator